MAIPPFKNLFSDVLISLSDGTVKHRRELISAALDRLSLSDLERAETMPGGGNRARNRVHWALEFLCQAQAVSRPKRGFAQISDFGRQLLAEQPGGVTLARLRQTDGLKDWKRRSQAKAAQREQGTPEISDVEVENEERTPLEQIDCSISEIRSSIASQLLQRLRDEKPEFLERTVLRLLHAMGYGSSEDDLQHLGGSNDGGVDGVIRQDKFGLDQIYIQAKRYGSQTVGRPHVQNFVGALTGQHATRGVFITTSDYSKEAREYAETIQQYRVILIDGEELVRLMIENKVGVTVSQSVEIVEIDENFFADE